MRVLVVEDERKVASFIKKGLQQEGYATDVVHDGDEAVHTAISFGYDLVVLDLMLPGRSGLDVLREIRQQRPRLPVLVLTAKGALEDRITGLDAGADDYLAKPFAFAELSARIRALLRRGSQQNTRLRLADLEMDTAAHQVRRARVLGGTEFSIETGRGSNACSRRQQRGMIAWFRASSSNIAPSPRLS